MAVYRQIRIDFWQDEMVVELSAEDKYFFLYLMTNNKTSQCGVYRINRRVMAFDLGWDVSQVDKLLERFVKYGKIGYNRDNDEIMISNWLKYNKATSPKVAKVVSQELEKIKTVEFKDAVIHQCEKFGYPIDTVSIPDETSPSKKNNGIDSGSPNEKYPMDTEPQKEKEKEEEKEEEKEQPQQQEKEKPTNDAVVAVQLSDVVAFFEQNISTATPFVIGELEDMLEDASYESVRYALEEAVARERRSLNYVKRIVDRCIAQKLFTFELIRLEEARRQQRQAGTNPDAKTPEWLEEEERESREHAARKKAELEAEVPDDAELAKLMSELKGGASA